MIDPGVDDGDIEDKVGDGDERVADAGLEIVVPAAILGDDD